MTHAPASLARRVAVALVAAATLVPATASLAEGPPARPAADAATSTAVLDWNAHAATALIARPDAAVPGAGLAPTVAVIHLAIVQAAVHDAVEAIVGGGTPYLDGLPAAPATASIEAAVATAAHDVLVGLRAGDEPLLAPAVAARLDGLLATSLAAATATDGASSVADGVELGAATAVAMLAERADDGRFPDPSPRFAAGDGIGEWRPELPSFASDPNAFVADVETFSIDDASDHRTKGPRELGTGAYAKEYDEVRRLGGDGVTTPHERTAEQDELAEFFSTHPIELWNRTLRAIAADEGLDALAQARLLALANVSGADAHIACWDDKRYWSFWRPITAIRAGDLDGNRRTEPDPTWTPLRTTPPYPEHPSGYNCVTAAFMHTAQRFFRGAPIEFDVVRIVAGEPDRVRTYRRFTDVVDDAIEVRILQGLHFRSADVQGAEIGRRVAWWVLRHEFRLGDGARGLSRRR